METSIRLGGKKIPIRLLVENEGFNDSLEIMFGTNFLKQVSPYSITNYGLQINYNDNIIYIPRWLAPLVFISLLD